MYYFVIYGRPAQHVVRGPYAAHGRIFSGTEAIDSTVPGPLKIIFQN
jgi:hypothetical protein